MADNSITLTLGYDATDFTRQVKFENLPNSAIVPATVKERVMGINASLTAGTAGGLSNVFLSDDGDNFTGIVAAKIDVEEETVLDISE